MHGLGSSGPAHHGPSAALGNVSQAAPGAFLFTHGKARPVAANIAKLPEWGVNCLLGLRYRAAKVGTLVFGSSCDWLPAAEKCSRLIQTDHLGIR